METVQQALWVPAHAAEQRDAWKVHQAVKQYDENLAFGRNEQTGQWCIFMRQGTTKATTTGDLPILGFNDIPSVDYALQRLMKTDARRRGKEILDELTAHNKSIEDVREKAAVDAQGQMAEAFEWGFRKQGKHTRPRIFVPGRD